MRIWNWLDVDERDRGRPLNWRFVRRGDLCGESDARYRADLEQTWVILLLPLFLRSTRILSLLPLLPLLEAMLWKMEEKNG